MLIMTVCGRLALGPCSYGNSWSSGCASASPCRPLLKLIFSELNVAAPIVVI